MAAITSRRFAETVRDYVAGRLRSAESELSYIVGQEVSLTAGDGPRLEVVFAHAERPGCQFGFAFPALPDGDPGDPWEPEEWGDVALANLRERLEAQNYGLPGECPDDGVVWLE